MSAGDFPLAPWVTVGSVGLTDWVLSSCQKSVAADAGEIAGVFFERRHDRFFARQAGCLNPFEGLEDAFVIFGHHFDELRNVTFPIGQNGLSAGAAGVGERFPQHLVLAQFPE